MAGEEVAGSWSNSGKRFARSNWNLLADRGSVTYWVACNLAGRKGPRASGISLEGDVYHCSR